MPSRASRPAPSSPRHPIPCRGKHCDALVWMKNVRRPSGEGKPLRIPLEAQPSDAGTVAARAYSGEPGRFLAQGEALANGESKWVSHFDTCVDAAAFRRHATTPYPPLF